MAENCEQCKNYSYGNTKDGKICIFCQRFFCRIHCKNGYDQRSENKNSEWYCGINCEKLKSDTSNNIEDGDNRFTTCIGCIENQPNQFAHMDEGGCLYDQSTDF